MSDPVLETVALGTQWPTIDPFLFCAHHHDAYPSGNGDFGPAAPLTGRQLGQDFAGKDGWNMYHGRTIPGFPQHPHRGFETITYVRHGMLDHSDSLGAAARFGQGDAQWMTAGSGIVHSEMFPLLDLDGPNLLHMFQIWLNLPAADKLVPPHFSMLWSQDIPTVTFDSDGPAMTVTAVAGAVAGHTPPDPPPHSWAADDDHDVAVWHLVLEPGARWTLPAARFADTRRVLYVFAGTALTIGDRELTADTAAVLACDQPVVITDTGAGVECLMLQGRPIGEPVAQYGPFVMNNEVEIRQAMTDYQATEFGGWPWPTHDPVHGAEPRRFARHADGRTETVEPAA